LSSPILNKPLRRLSKNSWKFYSSPIANVRGIRYTIHMPNNEEETTTFENKCNILAELWLDYREDPEFEDFVSYNDLGLPLGFMIAEDIVTPNQRARDMIEETFVLLLATLEVEDTGFDTLDDLMLG
jgi:hypothetical protein